MVNILTYLFLSQDAELLTTSLFYRLIPLSPTGIFFGADNF